MLWILRKTRLSGAAELLNALNSNGNDSRPAPGGYTKLLEDKNELELLDEQSMCQVNEYARDSPLESDVNSNSYINRDVDDFSSDDNDEDEALTCNVCDRTFACPKQMSSHKQKKRHYGCSACDSIFPSLMSLEHHKEEFEHWSDSDEDILTDSDCDEVSLKSEECERLL